MRLRVVLYVIIFNIVSSPCGEISVVELMRHE